MNSQNKHFNSLVEAGAPVGEVIAVERFMVKVKGLQPCRVHALVMFEDGSKGFIHHIQPDHVVILHLGTTNLYNGMVAVLQHEDLVTKVGENFIGRVVSVTGDPLDGKGAIVPDQSWPIFNQAVPLHLRKQLDQQVETGVTAVDALLPIVCGQRMALLGDSKSGKSTLATQMAINQKNSDRIVVYCLIAKRRSDIDLLLSRLKDNGAMDKVIVVVSTMFESLIISYLAPYVACTMAEYLWQSCDQDVVVVYDDLTAHAHAHREISLLSGVSPGRDSYPGDMFYAHSSLLERAGRLASSGRSLTAIPIVHVAGGDITSYLPTNIMSITDGQWILDMDIFRSGVRPALNFGMSVTRAGGAGHSTRQKSQAAKTLKILADYRQAQEFSHFGSELGDEAKKAFAVGKIILQILTQAPNVTYTLVAQQLMLDVITNLEGAERVDVDDLILHVNEYAAKVTKPEDFDGVSAELKKQCVRGFKHTTAPAATNTSPSSEPEDIKTEDIKAPSEEPKDKGSEAEQKPAEQAASQPEPDGDKK